LISVKIKKSFGILILLYKKLSFSASVNEKIGITISELEEYKNDTPMVCRPYWLCKNINVGKVLLSDSDVAFG